MIASGGAGGIQDFVTLFTALPKVDAGLAASIFHFGEVRIQDLKQALHEAGITDAEGLSMLNLEELKYNADGLISAIVIDTETKQVLMMAYMNAESLQVSMEEGRTCFGRAPEKNSGAKARRAETYSRLCPSRRTATRTHCSLR